MPRTIHIYRPQRTSPKYLEAASVAREPLVEEILGRLSRWQPGATRQHYLIIGPRGIGKTHLLRLVEHRIRTTPKLSKKWRPICLSEDAYGITRVSDLLVEALRILSEESGDTNAKRAYDRVKHDYDEARVTDLSLDALRRFHTSNGCGIVLMIENLNRVLERQMRSGSEIHLLRKILIEEDWLVVICTSPTYLNAVTQHDEPFFEFFQVHLLPELTPGQQQEMLYKLSILEKNTAFEGYLKKFRSRLQALYHFTGGNPRLTIMLYDLVANQNITDVKMELDFLLDQITPFYQDRMKEITELEGKLLETMALMPEGCTPSELAIQARMDAKLVRALVTRLERSGYIRREPRRLKRTVYIIPERFFRIWHQMNHSRAARGQVQYLLEFFSNWYATKEERDQVWNELMAKFESELQEGDEDRVEDLAEYMKYVAAVSEGGERFEREFELLRQTASRLGVASITQELVRLDQEYQADGDYFVHKGCFLADDLGLHEAALSAFRRAIDLKPGYIVPLFNEVIALENLGRESEARRALENVAVQLSRQRGRLGVTEVRDSLLHILREDTDSDIVKMAAYLLEHTASADVARDIIAILQKSEDSWRRQHCATVLGFLRAPEAVPVLLKCLRDEASNVRGSAATALGRIGSAAAVKPLIECLQDENRINRGSAATALGRIGSAEAVEPLIKCLRDVDYGVRASAVTALGRIASEIPIPHLAEVIGALVDEVADRLLDRDAPLVRMLLRSAFRSANLEMVRDSIQIVMSRLSNAEALCAPYVVALEYLQSNRDPAIMERQHPEMREAMQLLVDAFDEGRAYVTAPKIK